VEKAQMPRPHFIKVFSGSEGSKRWLATELNTEHPWSESLRRVEPSLLERLTPWLAAVGLLVAFCVLLSLLQYAGVFARALRGHLAPAESR